jgi:hypothetical protein
MMADDEIRALMKAHRAAMASIAWAVESRCPGALADIIGSLSRFEAGMRARNEADATIRELRRIREGLEPDQAPASGARGA